MPRICFVLVAGLDDALMHRSAGLGVLGLAHRAVYEPAFPAVTSTAQATLTTEATAADHGIICNGLYTRGHADIQAQVDLSNHAESRANVSFWEQSGGLVQRPRFWEGLGKKVAMLFWQNSMPSREGKATADIVLTPKPVHTPDGKTVTACWGAPADLYPTLAAKFGPFPLHNYWSPMAGLPSSQWIIQAADHVWRDAKPDLQLVYLPHLDYNLMRLGPSHPAIAADLAALADVLTPLAATVRTTGGTMIIAGDYGMTDVTTPIFPNRALRDAGLLVTKPDAEGKLLVDYEKSAAFVMADHQVAYVYIKPGRKAEVIKILETLAGIDTINEKITSNHFANPSLQNDRMGDLQLASAANAWFAHDWWHSDAEKPRWQFTVDIHNKPGFDPRELFFDRVLKCIAQDAKLVKGSHALTHDPARWPVLLSDAPLPAQVRATDIAGYLRSLLG